MPGKRQTLVFAVMAIVVAMTPSLAVAQGALADKTGLQKVVKLACVGDSITAGFGAPKGKAWPDQITKLLGTGWEVKNFGVSGTTLLSYQSTDAFKDAIVIDMYDLMSGDYEFSFYIYHLYGRKKMSEFRVFGDYLVARHEDVIRLYYLKPEYFRPEVNNKIKTHFMDEK